MEYLAITAIIVIFAIVASGWIEFAVNSARKISNNRLNAPSWTPERIRQVENEVFSPIDELIRGAEAKVVVERDQFEATQSGMLYVYPNTCRNKIAIVRPPKVTYYSAEEFANGIEAVDLDVVHLSQAEFNRTRSIEPKLYYITDN